MELTGLQMRVMRVVLDRGELTVTEVQEALPRGTLARTHATAGDVGIAEASRAYRPEG